MKDLILTYDIGTTGNKCSVFDHKGQNICSITVPYETIYPKARWSEQKASDFWESTITGTRALLEKGNIKAADIAVIGLSGHMNGCLPIDGNGNALCNEIIHSDCRSAGECREMSVQIDPAEYYNITGNRLDVHYSLPKMLWIKKNYPELYSKTAYFLNSKDYIIYKLTGNPGITDYSDASLTGLLDIQKKCWSDRLINLTGLDGDKLPQIIRSYDIAGYITEEAASLLGLKCGTPVTAGGGDGACATKGAGVASKYKAYNYIGSSSWISILNDRPIFDKGARIFNFYDLDGENCNVTGTVQCATISYDWVLNNIGGQEAELCRKNGLNVFDYIDGIAAGVPIGSNGVFFLPYLMGERTPSWDENTRGGFIGISLYNKREDLFRAVYEGIAYALKSVQEVFEQNGLSPAGLTLIGGGAISPFWNEIMCNVYNKGIKIHKYPREATSMGAALAAGIGAGMFSNFEEAVKAVEIQRQYEPDPQKAAEYAKYYKIYSMLYGCLSPVYKEIANL